MLNSVVPIGALHHETVDDAEFAIANVASSAGTLRDLLRSLKGVGQTIVPPVNRTVICYGLAPTVFR